VKRSAIARRGALLHHQVNSPWLLLP